MTTLAQYSRAEKALEKATRVDEILPLLDDVAHLKLHAQKIKDRSLLARANAFQERAERRLGEVIIEAKKAGHFPEGRPANNGTSGAPLIAKLSEVGIDKKLSARAQKAAALDAETFERKVQHLKERIVSGGAMLVDREERQAAKRERRSAREAELGARQSALPTKRYGVILADPPWRFKSYSEETGMDRAAENHYPTQSLDDILALDVAGIAADDCALFLWATAPMLPQALHVMGAWGFAYRTHAVWIKSRVITGYWFRGAHEILLLGTRGTVPCPAMGDQFTSVFETPDFAGRHSEKPKAFHQVVERYFPTLPKIELYRRGEPRPGWSAWGLEAEQPAEAAE